MGNQPAHAPAPPAPLPTRVLQARVAPGNGSQGPWGLYHVRHVGGGRYGLENTPPELLQDKRFIAFLLFLDIDGVLSVLRWGETGEIDQMCLQHVAQLAFRFSAKVVVSSSWRTCAARLSAIVKLLASVGVVVVGVTRDLRREVTGFDVQNRDHHAQLRADEIMDYVNAHKPGKWICVDDLPVFKFLPEDFKNRHLQTEADVGLSIQDLGRVKPDGTVVFRLIALSPEDALTQRRWADPVAPSGRLAFVAVRARDVTVQRAPEYGHFDMRSQEVPVRVFGYSSAAHVPRGAVLTVPFHSFFVAFNDLDELESSGSTAVAHLVDGAIPAEMLVFCPEEQIDACLSVPILYFANFLNTDFSALVPLAGDGEAASDGHVIMRLSVVRKGGSKKEVSARVTPVAASLLTVAARCGHISDSAGAQSAEASAGPSAAPPQTARTAAMYVEEFFKGELTVEKVGSFIEEEAIHIAQAWSLSPEKHPPEEALKEAAKAVLPDGDGVHTFFKGTRSFGKAMMKVGATLTGKTKKKEILDLIAKDPALLASFWEGFAKNALNKGRAAAGGVVAEDDED